MDLWSEASYDYDAERRSRNLEMAKATSEGTWSFLALANSPEEYQDRMALASDSIMSVAAQHGVDMRELTDIYNQRFALLMEAKGDNPFDDDSDDDTDDPSADDDDNTQGDDSDDSDDDGDGADDTDEQTDEDDDGDTDNADDDSKGKSEDPDQEDDEAKGKSTGISPWASRYASLSRAIEAGEDPLAWGSAPFVRSSARKEAADGAAPTVSDVNTPQPEVPSAPGMEGGIAETTKPRQMPEGGGMDPNAMPPGMGLDGIDPASQDAPTDPAMNGGDIQQGADDLPPAESSLRTAKIRAIAAEVRKYNPTLSPRQCQKVAARVYDQYLVKHAEDMNPLLFGDRANTSDGPLTNSVKNWSPADAKPGQGGGGGDQGGGSGGPSMGPKLPGGKMPSIPGGVAGEGAGAAEGVGAAAEVGEAAELLPLLAL